MIIGCARIIENIYFYSFPSRLYLAEFFLLLLVLLISKAFHSGYLVVAGVRKNELCPVVDYFPDLNSYNDYSK